MGKAVPYNKLLSVGLLGLIENVRLHRKFWIIANALAYFPQQGFIILVRGFVWSGSSIFGIFEAIKSGRVLQQLFKWEGEEAPRQSG